MFSSARLPSRSTPASSPRTTPPPSMRPSTSKYNRQAQHCILASAHSLIFAHTHTQVEPRGAPPLADAHVDAVARRVPLRPSRDEERERPDRRPPRARLPAAAREAPAQAQAAHQVGAFRQGEGHQPLDKGQEGLGRGAPGVGRALGPRRKEQGRRGAVAPRGQGRSG